MASRPKAAGCWPCEVCTFDNINAIGLACDMCGAVRVLGSTAVGTPTTATSSRPSPSSHSVVSQLESDAQLARELTTFRSPPLPSPTGSTRLDVADSGKRRWKHDQDQCNRDEALARALQSDGIGGASSGSRGSRGRDWEQEASDAALAKAISGGGSGGKRFRSSGSPLHLGEFLVIVLTFFDHLCQRCTSHSLSTIGSLALSLLLACLTCV
jgi:hypothetical protein